MIIFWYLLKEVVKTQVAVFLVVMTIFISNQLMRELSDASDGSIPGQLVMIFVGLSIPYLAGIILPLSLFLGVLLAYGRIYADNEMSVMHACGVSEWYVTRVTLVVSFVTAIITGTFTMYLAPMAIEYEYQVKDQLSADSGLSSLMAGRFQQTGNKKAVVFVHDKNRDDNSLEKVFMALGQSLFSPWAAGIILAAILSAVMSTVDSQLLVASSALVQDLYLPFFRPKASERIQMHLARFTVLLLSLVAYLMWFQQPSVLVSTHQKTP